MSIIKVLLIIITLVEIALADFKSCSQETNKFKICFTNEDGYEKPIERVVASQFVLKHISEINQDKNSINIQGSLWTNWYDPGLDRLNSSTE